MYINPLFPIKIAIFSQITFLMAVALLLSGGCGTPPSPKMGPYRGPNEIDVDNDGVNAKAAPSWGDRAQNDIPWFPWPPPDASARVVLPQALIQNDRPFKTLEDVNSALTESLIKTGYIEDSYYAIPNGFALVTKIERIEPDGTPHRDRFSFSFEPSSISPISLREYLRALFTANPGHYRIIVFAVTDIPFKQDPRRVSPEEAELWIPGGTQVLPKEIGNREWTAGFKCTALIYEFIHEQQKPARVLLPGEGALDGLTHLRGAKLWGIRLSAVFGSPH